MKVLKRLVSLLAATGLVVGMLATTAGTALADGSLAWNGVNGATACAPGTTGTVLWIFNPHSDAVPTDLYINGVQATGSWTNPGGSQNWHFTAAIPGTFSNISSASLDYTGTLGTNPIFTISGCNEGGRPPAADLTVVKDAAGSYDDTYSWTIAKAVDKTYVEVPTNGGTATFNYTVTVNHGTSVDSNVKVTGSITVFNPNSADVTIDGVTDTLSDGTTCAVSPSSAGKTVPGDGSLGFTYECDLSAVPTADLFNTVTVAWSEQILSNGSLLAAGDAAFTTTAISFTANEIDTCVTVTDTIAGTLGTVCVGDANPTSFMYANQVPAPALGSCVDVDNTATFTTNDTKTTGSDSKTVTVCRFNAPLTPGYWKNHAANAKNSGPYSSTLCKTLKYSSCSNNGVWTIQYLPQTLGTFSVANIGVADGIWGLMNCSSSSDQGAVGCLAGHLLAAKLNVANIANPCISPTIASADLLLASVGYSGPTWTGTLTPAQRALAISLKTTLDTYNNGGGC